MKGDSEKARVIRIGLENKSRQFQKSIVREIDKYKVSEHFRKNTGIEIGVSNWERMRVKEMCAEEEGCYPSTMALRLFKRTVEGLEIKESEVAGWCKRKCKGLYLKKRRDIR